MSTWLPVWPHRDVKPDNFLFLSHVEDAPLKATDFGLSIRHWPDEPKLTSRSGGACVHASQGPAAQGEAASSKGARQRLLHGFRGPLVSDACMLLHASERFDQGSEVQRAAVPTRPVRVCRHPGIHGTGAGAAVVR